MKTGAKIQNISMQETQLGETNIPASSYVENLDSHLNYNFPTFISLFMGLLCIDCFLSSRLEMTNTLCGKNLNV